MRTENRGFIDGKKMKNYIIGQYGHFSNEKFKKDY